MKETRAIRSPKSWHIMLFRSIGTIVFAATATFLIAYASQQNMGWSLFGPVLIGLLFLIGSVGLMRMHDAARVFLGWLLISASLYVGIGKTLISKTHDEHAGLFLPTLPVIYLIMIAIILVTIAIFTLSPWAGKVFLSHKVTQPQPKRSLQ